MTTKIELTKEQIRMLIDVLESTTMQNKFGFYTSGEEGEQMIEDILNVLETKK